MKYLYVRLTKYVQDLSEKFYKILVAVPEEKWNKCRDEYVVEMPFSPVWPIDSKQSSQNPGNGLVGIDKFTKDAGLVSEGKNKVTSMSWPEDLPQSHHSLGHSALRDR